MHKRHSILIWSKQPDDLPLWVANLKKIKLSKNGYALGLKKDINGVIYHPYFGKGLTVYQFDLRTDSGRTIGTEYIRARNPTNALNKIKKFWPTVKGVKLI